MHDRVVDKSILTGPNGELIFTMTEDVTSYEKANAIIKHETNGFSDDKTRRMNVSVPPRLYYYWARVTGSEECWLDPSFLRTFMNDNPQYATCNGKI